MMGIIYLNNEWLDDNQPVISSKDRGFLLGDGIFETIKVVSNQIQFFDDHWRRFSQSAEFLKFSLSITKSELKNSIHRLVVLNQLEYKVSVIRLTLTRGIGERGVQLPSHGTPTCMITAHLYIPNPKNEISLYISSWRKNEYSPLSNIKSLNYLENILAREEAKTKGYDDALLLNTKGNLAATTIANFFMVVNQKIVTAPIEDGVLPGIMRANILALAKQREIEVIERSLSLDDIDGATEAFISNALIEIIPVKQINQQLFTQDRQIYKRLLQ